MLWTNLAIFFFKVSKTVMIVREDHITGIYNNPLGVPMGLASIHQ